MNSKILAIIDGSESSKKAFNKSLFIARKKNASLGILYITVEKVSSGFLSMYTTSLSEFGYYPEDPFILDKELKWKGEQALSIAQSEAGRNGIETSCFYLKGNKNKIMKFIKKRDYDLIVFANKLSREFEKSMFNSTKEVSQTTNCHILKPIKIS